MNVPSRPPRIRRSSDTVDAAHEQPAETDVTAPLATVGNGTAYGMSRR
jgi:hypothetical protein